MSETRIRRSILNRRVVPPSLVLIFLVSSQAPAQETPLAEEQTVTALDVFVEVGAPADSKSPVPDLPRNLGVRDFELQLEGERVEPLGFADPRAGRWHAESEPWEVVVYFDLRLAERDSVRWAASELAERAEDLVELGPVEIVVAEEAPRSVLAATGDVLLLENQLAGLALDPKGFHEAIELRAANLEPDGTPREEASEASAAWGRSMVENEVASVARRLDEMLVWLVEREPHGSRKVLIWITDGFDLEPARFYRERGLSLPTGMASLSEPAGELARTLAGYGWVTLSFAPLAPGPGLVPGKRFGKWLYRPRMPSGLIGGTLTREERRDPDKAESYLEIGETQLGLGDAESAREAFERALYHFAGDPRTRLRQAAGKAGLARSLEALGRLGEARQAFRHAVELDPKLAAHYPQAELALLDPAAGLDAVALETAGRTVRDSEAVGEALSSLGRRARLTYQVSGRPKGELGRLDVTVQGSRLTLRYPRWVRSGTPVTVAAARARLLLAGRVVEGPLEVTTTLEAAPDSETALRVRLVGAAGRPPGPRELRVSIAAGRPEGTIRVRHERIELPAEVRLSEWVYRATLESLGEEEWVAVVVEDVETGDWGAGLAE